MPVEQRAYGNLLLSIITEIKAPILTVDGKVVGCALGVLQSDLQGVFDLLTAKDVRAKGVATLLLNALDTWGIEIGVSYRYLQVKANKHPVNSDHQALGYQNCYG